MTEVHAPVRIPSSRYTSGEFAQREHDSMWPLVWAVACTVDHVAEPGDFFEYRNGQLSVIVVRDDDGRLRAFQNVCLHRGNQLCQGSGSGLSEIRCPYHRWAWDLQGSLREVPSRRGFGVLNNDELGLVAASVDTWGPLVFVNLDPHAVPLADYLEGVVHDTAWANLDEFHCPYATTSRVESNWKVVADGFSETYHVQGIHPEMLASIDDVNTDQQIWDRHSVSRQDYGVASPRLRDGSDQAVWHSFVETQGDRMGPAYKNQLTMPPLAAGQGVRDKIAELIREHQATRGVDMTQYTTEHILRLSQYNLFPNTTVLVWADMVNVLTSRPGPDVNSAELTMYVLYRGASARPLDVAVDASMSLGTVIDQDLVMLKRFQKGLQQPGFTQLTLSREECRIINMHRVLMTYVGEG